MTASPSFLTRTLLALPLLAALTAAAPDAPDAAANDLSILLTPRTAAGTVTSIVVRETFGGAALPADALLLTLPNVASSVPGVLGDPSTLVASDAAGPLPLRMVEDPVDPTGIGQDRHWRTLRATRGAITVTYRADPRVITAQTRAAALIDLRTEGAGVHGSTRMLLAVPETGWPRTVRIAWALEAMAPGSRAASSFGDGTTVTTLDRATFGKGYVMAGPWQRLPPAGGDGFMVYYLTPPAFDLSGAAADVAQTYRYATRFFGTPLVPFRAFMRTTERFQGGGGGGHNSFMFGTVRGEPRDPDELSGLLAHEAIHNWIGDFGETREGQWLTEGATNYYAAILPFRAGHETLAEVQRRIGEWTTDYYGNIRRTMPDAAAAAAFWTDSDAQLLPYSRGALYVAMVDARMRAASGGRRRVDDLIRPMVAAIRNGTASEAMWQALVTRALGTRGRDEFLAMKAGRMLDLPENLFGPCFRREAKQFRRYLPGFSMTAAPGGKAVVGYVQPQGAAARAGIRTGDVILTKADLDRAKSTPGTNVTLQVMRGNSPIAIDLAPWGPAQRGYHWTVRQPRLDGSGCAL